MEQTDAEDYAHEETADVGEVVKAGEQAKDEGDDDVEADEQEVLPRRGARRPGVKQV